MKKDIKKFIKEHKKMVIASSVLAVGIISVSGYFMYSNNSKSELKTDVKIEAEIIPQEGQINIIDVNSDSRPYAVMINNNSDARKYHMGLQEAYITYEIIVEGGITRLLALYKDSDVDEIGSVRSSRHYYLDYALEHDAIYVHWGWSDQAKSDITSLGINNLNGLTYEGSGFYRESLSISSENTGYTKMSSLISLVEKNKYSDTTNQPLLFGYSASNIKFEDASSASTVDISFSSSNKTSFIYDEENEYYNVEVNGTKHIDYETKIQYNYKNIITYQVENYTISGDTKGRQDLENIGSGKGYFISNGECVEIKWEKTSRTSQTKYTLLNGEELVVNDGNTYIAIQPVGQNLTIN